MGLRKCKTKLTAYNGTNIPQLGALDTVITWKDEETKKINKMNTTFYVIDTPGPAILGSTQEAWSTYQNLQGKGKCQTGY